MTKSFSWSWSRLKNYRTCPKRHWEIDIAKNVKEPLTEPLRWGNELHEAMHLRLEKGRPLPSTMGRFHAWPDNVDRAIQKRGPKAQLKVENKLAMTKEFEPCGFFDDDCWFRGVVDVLLLLPSGKSAVTIDWKTGNKIKPEMEQLALSAQLVFAHYPEVDNVLAIYVWFGHKTQTTKRYNRAEMVPFWNELWPSIKTLEEAHRTTTYPPKPSGICINWCAVTSCPYHGKGSPR